MVYIPEIIFTPVMERCSGGLRNELFHISVLKSTKNASVDENARTPKAFVIHAVRNYISRIIEYNRPCFEIIERRVFAIVQNLTRNV